MVVSKFWKIGLLWSMLQVIVYDGSNVTCLDHRVITCKYAVIVYL